MKQSIYDEDGWKLEDEVLNTNDIAILTIKQINQISTYESEIGYLRKQYETFEDWVDDKTKHLKQPFEASIEKLMI
jgi:hypothetical protein